MADWIEYAKIAGAFVGAGGVATLAKLYHDKVVAGKSNEIRLREAEIDRLRNDLVKAENRARTAEQDSSPGQRDLGKLRDQLTEILERLAAALPAQAASLYVPVVNAHDDGSEVPRGFAFVAVHNDDAAAASAILRLKLVEGWTIVGECWTRGTVLADNELQTNVRHVASYDKQSGFVPLHTLVAPVRWQNRQVGVLQVFNRTIEGRPAEIDARGFGADDRKALAEVLQESAEGSLAAKIHYFATHPDCMRFLGLQDELRLENAVIMYLDLTRSSSLFDELPLIDAARLINRFDENVYLRLAPFLAVVEKFNGDGTLVRFHYGGLEVGMPASNPAFRALCAAADLLRDFRDFKARRWQALASDASDAVKLRVSLTLGPVVSTNVGPRQFQVPTVMGGCVNRAAKMVAYAPRDRDVVLVDDNVRKALLQVDRAYATALKPWDAWTEDTARHTASLAGHAYYEANAEAFRGAAAEMRLSVPLRAA